jgi:hypothetical protein
MAVLLSLILLNALTALIPSHALGWLSLSYSQKSLSNSLNQKEFISIRPVQDLNPNRRSCLGFEPEITVLNP